MMEKEKDGDDDNVSWQRRYTQNAIVTLEVVKGRGMVCGVGEKKMVSCERRARGRGEEGRCLHGTAQ